MFIVDIFMPERLSSKRDIVTTRNFKGLDQASGIALGLGWICV